MKYLQLALKGIKYLLFFLLGGLLFIYLLLCLVFSYFSQYVNKGFGKSKSYKFREEDYISQNIDTYIPKLDNALILGNLPIEMEEIYKYVLPDEVSSSANELLIRASLIQDDQNLCCEYEYSLSAGITSERTYFFLFTNPFNDNPSINYSECLFWYKLCSVREIEIELKKSINTNLSSIQSRLEIISWR